MSERRYSKDHVWAAPADGTVRVGLSGFAREELGDVVFLELPEPGTVVSAGDAVCSLDSLKSSSEIYAPVSGRIVEVNEEFREGQNLDQLNADPEGAGWIFTIEMNHPEEFGSLMTEAEYGDFVQER